MSTDDIRARILRENAYYETHIKPLVSGDAKRDEPVPTLDMGRPHLASMLRGGCLDLNNRPNRK